MSGAEQEQSEQRYEIVIFLITFANNEVGKHSSCQVIYAHSQGLEKQNRAKCEQPL